MDTNTLTLAAPGDRALIVAHRYGTRTITRAEIIGRTPKQLVVKAANGLERRWWLDGRGEVGSTRSSRWEREYADLITEHDKRFSDLEDELDYHRRKNAMAAALMRAEKMPESLTLVTEALNALGAWKTYLEGRQAAQQATDTEEATK